MDASCVARARRRGVWLRSVPDRSREARGIQNELSVHQSQTETVLRLRRLRRGHSLDLRRIHAIFSKRQANLPNLQILRAARSHDTASERPYFQEDCHSTERSRREYVPVETNV